MKYLLILIFVSQFLFSAELTRKIMVSSFHSMNDAQYALKIFNENRTAKFDKLQAELNFKVIARASDNMYVIAIEAFKDYKEAKTVLNEILALHPDAYINKYTASSTVGTSESVSKILFEKKEVVERKINTNKLKEKEVVRTNKSFSDLEKEEANEYLGTNLKVEANKKQISETEKTIEKEESKIELNDERFNDSNKYSFMLHSSENIQERVKRNLSVYPLIKDSSIIKIEFKDSTPLRSSEFVNQLLTAYLAQNKNENTKQLQESLTFLEIQLEKSKEELSIAEKELELFRSQNLLFNIDKKVEQINKQKDDLQIELLSVTRKNKIFDSIKESLLRGESISTTSFDDNALNDLIKQLDEQKSLQQELSAKYTPAHKRMISLAEKIKGLEDNIIKNVKNISLSFNESIKSLEGQISELDKEILILPKVALELARLERVFNLKESVHKALLLKYNDSTSNFISSKRVNRVIDYAQPPEFAVKPKKSMIFIIGFMFALLVAFIVVLLREYFDVYLKKSSDLISLTTTPYFGYIPFIKSKNYNKLFVLDDLLSPNVEALRQIRANLELTIKKDNSRVVLATSRVSNEGKSTFISNLAVMIALSGKKVIILGLDLRIPQLHLKFDLDNKKGMSDLLANNVSIEDVTQRVKIKDNQSEYFIDVVTSGTIPPNPSELISNGAVDNIIEKLREEYDYILIDSTPTALVPDTHSLFSKVDTTLFVFKSEYSKKEFVKQTNELINKYDLKSTGYILTSVKKKYYEQIKYDKNYTLYATKLYK
ncbi:GumC family protein [Arcobacter sp. s6]|uniref:GumC family protein n=1 Tax=Arcobacter sp. s6 TaxID=3230363 RepID=UPI00349FD2C2